MSPCHSQGFRVAPVREVTRRGVRARRVARVACFSIFPTEKKAGFFSFLFLSFSFLFFFLLSILISRRMSM